MSGLIPQCKIFQNLQRVARDYAKKRVIFAEKEVTQIKHVGLNGVIRVLPLLRPDKLMNHGFSRMARGPLTHRGAAMNMCS